MDYIPVYDGEDQGAAGTVKVSADRIQTLGVRIEPVSKRSLARVVRAVGTIEINERGQHTVAPKFEGWIEKLHVNTTGQAVARGQPLAEVYSPELVSAQREYLIAFNAIEGHGRRRRRCAGRRAAARQRGARAAAQLGHQRRAAGTAARGRRAAPHADDRRARRGRHHQGPAGGRDAVHARRGAVPDRRPVAGVDDRRRVRAGPRAGPHRLARDAGRQRLSGPDFPGRAHVHLSDPERRDAHRARALRTGQPAGPVEAGDVRHRADRRRGEARSAGGAGFGGDQQRQPAGGARRARRRPLRAARSEDGRARRRIRRGAVRASRRATRSSRAPTS